MDLIIIWFELSIMDLPNNKNFDRQDHGLWTQIDVYVNNIKTNSKIVYLAFANTTYALKLKIEYTYLYVYLFTYFNEICYVVNTCCSVLLLLFAKQLTGRVKLEIFINLFYKKNCCYKFVVEIVVYSRWCLTMRRLCVMACFSFSWINDKVGVNNECFIFCSIGRLFWIFHG